MPTGLLVLARARRRSALKVFELRAISATKHDARGNLEDKIKTKGRKTQEDRSWSHGVAHPTFIRASFRHMT
jgi:hypothetical protein